MSASQETNHYKLPIFEMDDIPSWLDDFNGAMNDIDSAIYQAYQAAQKDPINVVQNTGTSLTHVMSQNAVTEALKNAGGGGSDYYFKILNGTNHLGALSNTNQILDEFENPSDYTNFLILQNGFTGSTVYNYYYQLNGLNGQYIGTTNYQTNSSANTSIISAEHIIPLPSSADDNRFKTINVLLRITQGSGKNLNKNDAFILGFKQTSS